MPVTPKDVGFNVADGPDLLRLPEMLRVIDRLLTERGCIREESIGVWLRELNLPTTLERKYAAIDRIVEAYEAVGWSVHMEDDCGEECLRFAPKSPPEPVVPEDPGPHLYNVHVKSPVPGGRSRSLFLLVRADNPAEVLEFSVEEYAVRWARSDLDAVRCAEIKYITVRRLVDVEGGGNGVIREPDQIPRTFIWRVSVGRWVGDEPASGRKED
jgi:hypothetical protein